MCGNFGILLLLPMERKDALRLLRRMLQITSVRGAQSASIVTYETPQSRHLSLGLRCRVVNGKRTCLADLCLDKLTRSLPGSVNGSYPSSAEPSRLFQGHTRFATSSICNLEGCHPHQWLPRNIQTVWRLEIDGRFVSERRAVEGFITHNGDLDFFAVNGVTYALPDIQRLLAQLLGRPMPSDVDSACIAGLLDLLRTKGLWLASARYGYLFGALNGVGGLGGDSIHLLADATQLAALAAIFEEEWSALVRSFLGYTGTYLALSREGEQEVLDGGGVHIEDSAGERSLLEAYCAEMVSRMRARLARLAADSAGVPNGTQKNGGDKGGGAKDSGGKRGGGKGSVKGSVKGSDGGVLPLPGLPAGWAQCESALHRLAEVACRAFFFGDLLRAGRELMAGAQGSFGLVLSHSLDCQRDLVIAARGQTMSIAFYPSTGLVVFGSESAATKVGMGVPGEDGSFRFDLQDVSGETCLLRWAEPVAAGTVDGAVCGAGTPGSHMPICCAGAVHEATVVFRYAAHHGADGRGRTKSALVSASDASQNVLLCVNLADGSASGSMDTSNASNVASADTSTRRRPSPGQLSTAPAQPPSFAMWRRRLKLDGNPALSPPAEVGHGDTVGRDLLEIPAVIERITNDFDGEAHSPNRITAWTFTCKLRQRLQAHRAGTHDGSVDLLITGCEVSLWLGEQFASDLALAYPKLKTVTLSANKLLGQLGQRLPIPQPGFPFNAASHDFRNTVVLVLTHSGGTYSPLLCCSLFKGFTSSIFVVTSELDTQAARAVRTGAPTTASAGGQSPAGRDAFVDLNSQYVFSTHAGFRPAEACSLSVAAMHHLLSHVLIFALGFLSHFEHGEPSVSICASGYDFEEVRELAALARLQADALRGIIGHKKLGDTPTSAALRKQGGRWAQHVLEGPLAWLSSVAYIALTIFLAATPLSAAVSYSLGRALPTPLPSPSAIIPPALNASVLVSGDGTSVDEVPPAWLYAVRYVVAFLDVTIYSFLGWWTTVAIRLVQGRPWLHRVAGRSVLIGDVPWVAQSIESFASKLFSLSYSIAGCTFMSANPCDHLVHRHTHRVVRGSLLAVGRPDGRVNALTTAEASCALSVSQASSIQNYGVRCESITLGHNLFPLPLAAGHLVLPTVRPPFLSEVIRELDGEVTPGSSVNPSHLPTPNPSTYGSRHAHDALNQAASRLANSRAESHEPSTRGGSAFFVPTPATDETLVRPSPLVRRRTPSFSAHAEGFFSERMLLDQLASGAVTSPPNSSREHSQHGASRDRSQHGASRDRSLHGMSLVRLGSSREASLHAGSRGREATKFFTGTASPREPGPRTAGPSRNASFDFDSLSDSSPGHAGLAHAQSLFQRDMRRSREGALNNLAVFAEAAEPLISLAEGEPTISLEVPSPRAEAPPSVTVPSPRPSHAGSPPSTTSPASPMASQVSPPPSPPIVAPPSTPPSPPMMPAPKESPNVIKANLERLGQRSRKLFDRAAGPMNGASLAAFKNAVFKLEPIVEPFLGAWMTRQAKYRFLDTDELMRRQSMVQILSETRFDALQRLCSFYVLFHAMGKRVADWWPRASFGLLQYDMSRSQSIMRVATTASPVSGMEVRERMMAIETETRRSQAASSVQRVWRSVRLKRWIRQGVHAGRAAGRL